MSRRVCRSMGALPRRAHVRFGYTLVEILVGTLLTLLLLMAVVQIFGTVSESIANSRAALEMAEQLRGAQLQLHRDLEGVTSNVLRLNLPPPDSPSSNSGYFEITEGPLGPVIAPEYAAVPEAWPRNIDVPRAVSKGDPDTVPYEVDTTVSDIDDMLMFTTRSRQAPFVGRVLVKRALTPEEAALEASGTPVRDGTDPTGPFKLERSAESQEAEVAWFVRGRTLYRRVLLVQPNFDADLRTPAVVEMQLDSRRGSSNPPYPLVPVAGPGFYRDYDISVRNNDAATALAANALSDLTKPENRFAHRHVHQYPSSVVASGYPFHPHFAAQWNDPPGGLNRLERTVWANVGLPTLRECSFMHPSDKNPGQDLTLPDCVNSWFAGARLPILPAVAAADITGPFDAWLNPYPWRYLDRDTGCLQLPHLNAPNPPSDPPPPPYPADNPPRYLGPRVGEDVILTNVVGFDVKVWDPMAPVLFHISSNQAFLPGDRGYIQQFRQYLNDPDPQKRDWEVSYGAYVDLDYLCHLYDPKLPGTVPSTAASSAFSGPGDNPALRGTDPFTSSNPSPTIRAAVYDTWSAHYESDGDDTNRNGVVDEGTDGFDNNNNGVVDEPAEQEAPPPYAVPLRGIQIRLRVFEPASRQVREVTIVQDFLAK